MQKLTIYDISQLAGVSITTVSRVLNGNDSVNPVTRAKVEEIINQHGYVPKQKARNFTRMKSYTVALILDDIRHAYMSELAYAIIQQLCNWKVNAIVCNFNDVEREFIDKIDALIHQRVNGIILMGSIFEKNICRVAIERRYSEFPFVTVNANLALPNVCEVLQDHVQGMVDAVRYLNQINRKKIAFIYLKKSNSDQRKMTGFIKGIEECGLDASRILQAETLSQEAGNKATCKLLIQYPDVDAIIYSGERLAVGGVHALNDLGIPIPEQIAIISFNNAHGATVCYPPLTSIDNKIAESGKTAAQMMINILNREKVENVMLSCGLVIRQSTEK